jgi:F-type H+-transporting ATPase subunit alpha
MNEGADRQLDLLAAIKVRGSVTQVGDGVARITGLRGVGYEELLEIEGGAMAMAYDIGESTINAVLLSETASVRAGMGATGTGELPSLPVGDELIGRILDPLGKPLDGLGRPGGERMPVYRPAPVLTERASVNRPLHTGTMAVDAAIPIGRGQRQLIIGDRNVGKTALALDIINAQKSGDVLCVYVVIGQPLSRVLSLRQSLRDTGALNNTVIIAGTASMAPGMQYLAPPAGATVAEWFRERGHDALVIYDDLTKHADAYRELALLVGRPPGREAYPGDIFYIHAELLERATPLNDRAGGGSVTAFPLVETTESDISAYIPTNLISITDGQIYLDSTRFERNQRPAIDVGRSVSRIGGVAQSPALRAAARNLRILIARFESLEALTRVGLDVDPATRRTIHRGQILREVLRQERFSPRGVAEQVVVLTAVAQGWREKLDPEDAAEALWEIAHAARKQLPELMAALDAWDEPPKGWEDQLKQFLAEQSEASDET